MIILFEGFEKTGKTEISQEIAKKLGAYYFKSKHEPKVPWEFDLDYEEAFKHDWRFFLDFISQNRDIKIVIDRGFPSEWVYAYAYRPDKVYSEFTQIAITYSRLFNELDGVMVYLYRADYSDLSWDDPVPKTDKGKIHRLYREFIRISGIRTVSFVYPYPEIDELLRSILDTLEEAKNE